MDWDHVFIGRIVMDVIGFVVDLDSSIRRRSGDDDLLPQADISKPFW